MFNEHGSFNVTIEGDVLLLVVTGAWNLETTKAYKYTVLKTINSAPNDVVGILSNVNDWELCTPDCGPVISQLIVECRNKGLKLDAVVNSNLESVKMELLYKLANNSTYEISASGLQRRFFKTEAEAREWLSREGCVLK